MVVDSLVAELYDECIFTQGYFDDLTVLVRDKFESTLGDRMRTAIRIVERWCQERGLKVNPEKTDLILFSRRLSGFDLIGEFRLFGKVIDPGSQVKYLGVILDNKLNWITHVGNKAHP